MTVITTQCDARISSRKSNPNMWRTLFDLMSLSRQRRALGKLDGHQLRDIGLNARDAQIEASKPLWDVPAHWRR